MLGHLLEPEIAELVRSRDFAALRDVVSDWEPAEIADLIDDLAPAERAIVFRLLPRPAATEVFEHAEAETQKGLVEALAQDPLARILNDMSPDDRTGLLEELPAPVTSRLLQLLTPEKRRLASRLLGYPEDSVGRLMTPQYVWVRPDWTILQALEQMRRLGRESETLDVVYVVDERGRLVDDLDIRELLLADPSQLVSQVTDGRFAALRAADDQEETIEVFQTYDRVALPVTDSGGVLLGIVTVDDVLDVVEEEATEDMHKIGGSEALEEPYLLTPFWDLIRKRARWLVVLLMGQMLTAAAMAYYEAQLAAAVVLAFFVPMIISSGGNTGSQAATFIIRAMALGEVAMGDWWRVLRREILSGFVLGAILGTIGIVPILLGAGAFAGGERPWGPIALTIGAALLFVVLWGAVSGAMLPFLLRRLGADPAASSAPLVATLVDVIGIVIYFGVASLFLAGLL